MKMNETNEIFTCYYFVKYLKENIPFIIRLLHETVYFQSFFIRFNNEGPSENMSLWGRSS